MSKKPRKCLLKRVIDPKFDKGKRGAYTREHRYGVRNEDEKAATVIGGLPRAQVAAKAAFFTLI